MKPLKLAALASLALALLLGGTGWWLKGHGPQPARSAEPNAHQDGTPGANMLQAEIDTLEAEHARLLKSLDAIKLENTRLEKVRDQAEHAARLFKELAEQSTTQDQNPTNLYPTPRHAFVGVGKQGRLMAELEAKYGNVDEDKLPRDERKALERAGLVIASELLRLEHVLEQQRDAEQSIASAKTNVAQTAADNVSCYLYGALDLDSGQFSSINGILEKYCQQAVQDKLWQRPPGESGEAETNRLATLRQLDQNARSEIQSLLSARQGAIFSNSTFMDLKFIAPTYKNFRFIVPADLAR